jgi:hypothetical protein
MDCERATTAATRRGAGTVHSCQPQRYNHDDGQEEWDLLRQVYQTRRVGPDVGYQTLIRRRLVFEYRDGDGSWYTVNPILIEATELQA